MPTENPGAARACGRSRHALLICLAVLTAAAVTAALFLLLERRPPGREPSASARAGFDGAASAGALSPAPAGDLQPADLFVYRLNRQVSVAGGEADFRIENPVENRSLMKVTITLEDGTAVYTTGLIKPNYSIASDKPDAKMKKGVYAATAKIEAFDRVTRAPVSEAAEPIQITVQ